jgi:hypothetical protein
MGILDSKATVKAAWIEALRSGKYEQTQGTLARDEVGHVSYYADEAACFCCLGVLSKLVCEADPEAGNVLDYGHVDVVIDREQQETLVDMNDGDHDADTGEFKRYTFPQIADWIEQNVEVT